MSQLSHAARMGITFYLVRAMWCYLQDFDASGTAWAEKGVDMLRKLRPDVGAFASEISFDLKLRIETWMRESSKQYDYGRAFDLAVDAAYDLDIVCAEQNFEIPVYVVEIAESIMGSDDVEEERS